MNLSKTGLGALAFAAALTLAGQAGAVTTVSSTFDTGADGWGYGTWQGVGGNVLPVTYDAAGGLITSTYGFAGWGYIAPAKFLGEKSEFIGGSLSFDLSSVFNNYSGKRPLVVFSGKNGMKMFGNLAGGPSPQLGAFNISLSTASFQTGSDINQGPRVSDDLFQSIMADLRQIEIYADWSPNVDTVTLDNVIMRGPEAGAVPEPATWAMMILGFGAAGTVLRRRRAVVAV